MRDTEKERLRALGEALGVFAAQASENATPARLRSALAGTFESLCLEPEAEALDVAAEAATVAARRVDAERERRVLEESRAARARYAGR